MIFGKRALTVLGGVAVAVLAVLVFLAQFADVGDVDVAAIGPGEAPRVAIEAIGAREPAPDSGRVPAPGAADVDRARSSEGAASPLDAGPPDAGELAREPVATLHVRFVPIERDEKIELEVFREDAPGSDGLPMRVDVIDCEGGRAELRLAGASYRLIATNGARIGAERVGLVPGDVRSVEIRLAPAVDVIGRVLASGSGAPLEGARVWSQTIGESRAVRADAQGWFHLHDLPANGRSQALHVMASGCGREVAWIQVDTDGSWRSRTPGGASVGPGPPSAPGPSPVPTDGEVGGDGGLRVRTECGATPPAIVPDVLLVDAKAIRGRVVDGTTGAPVAGAAVAAEGHYVVRPGMAFPDRAATRTAASGEFTLGLLRSDVAHVVRVLSPDHAAEDRLVPATRAGEHDLGTISLSAPAALVGTVRDAFGEPAEGTALRARELTRRLAWTPDGAFPRDPAHGQSFEVETVADSSGRFRLDGLRVGRWELRVVALGETLAQREVEVLEGAETNVSIVLPGEVAKLRGAVRTPRGSSSFDGRVRLFSSDGWMTVQLDRRGNFCFHGVEPREGMRLRADGRMPGGAAYSGTVTLDGPDPPVIHLSAVER